MMNEEKLETFVLKQHECPGHGYPHWRNVEYFGLMMAEGNPAADKEVIRWFAYVHDCMRVNCFNDIGHGERAAQYVDMIRSTYLSELTDSQVAILRKACSLHDRERMTGDPTIDICFDADRIDLQRFERPIVPLLLATDTGREVAKMDYNELARLAKESSGDVPILSSEYDVTSPHIGQIAVRCNGQEGYSPFVRGVSWTGQAKSVRITKQYFEAGIYCVPLHSFRDDNSWFKRFERDFTNPIYCLLEFEMYDIKKHVVAPHMIDGSRLYTPKGMAEEELALWKANIIYTSRAIDFTDEAIVRAIEEFKAAKPVLYGQQLRKRLERWENENKV
jgi:uncharacterized protein